MKKRTSYDFVNLRQTVINWVGAQIKELVEEKMGSGTKVEQNDFKVAVEQFTKRYQEVAAKLDNTDQTRQEQAAENLDAAHLETSLIFDLDNEPISGLDTSAITSANPSTNNTRFGIPSIVLDSQIAKHRRTEANSAENTSGDALLAASLRESIAILADALQTSRSVSTTPPSVNAAIEEQVHQVENAINNIRDMVEQVLEALAAQKKAAKNRAVAN